MRRRVGDWFVKKSELTVGLFPALCGGLKNLNRTGQLERFVDYYLRPYADQFGKVYYFSTFNESLDDYLPAIGKIPNVTVVPNRLRIHRWVYPFVLPIIHRKIFRKLDVARIFQFDGIIPVLIWRLFKRLPLVATYGYSYEETARLDGGLFLTIFYSILIPIGLKHVNGIIVTRQEMKHTIKKRLEKREGSKSSIYHIPNGVDTGVFSPQPKRKVPKDKRVVLFIGRLEPVKDPEVLLEAIARFEDERRPLIRFIGSGSLEATLKQKARDLGVHADFLGTVPHRELANLLHGADVFILPSKTEGQPKALLEAMSCGLPCIVSDCEGNRSIIRDGLNGLLFHVGDAQSLVSQLRKVLSDDDLARNLGTRARHGIIECHDIRKLIKKEMDILFQIGTK